MDLRLISANDLISDIQKGWDMDTVNGITAATVLKQIITDIQNEPTIKAVPYYEIAKTILKIRAINSNFDYIPRKEVIDILWRLIDEKPKEAADDCKN